MDFLHNLRILFFPRFGAFMHRAIRVLDAPGHFVLLIIYCYLRI